MHNLANLQMKAQNAVNSSTSSMLWFWKTDQAGEQRKSLDMRTWTTFALEITRAGGMAL